MNEIIVSLHPTHDLGNTYVAQHLYELQPSENYNKFNFILSTESEISKFRVGDKIDLNTYILNIIKNNDWETFIYVIQFNKALYPSINNDVYYLKFYQIFIKPNKPKWVNNILSFEMNLKCLDETILVVWKNDFIDDINENLKKYSGILNDIIKEEALYYTI